MKKVLVSLPDELVDELDREAAQQGKARSRIVQEAARMYLAERTTREQRRDRQRRVIEEMRALAELVDWGPGTAEEWIREVRDSR